MLSLNRKIASLILVAGSITNREMGDSQLTNQKLANKTVDFAKVNDSFAASVLDTRRRVASVFIGAGSQVLPNANSMDVSALMAGVPVSTGLPTYDASGTRTWSNLGAATYAPTGGDAGNKVLIRKQGAQGPDATETLVDANGREIFGRLTNAGGANGTWTVSFYAVVATVETATVAPASSVPAFLVYRQWVPGSSTLLEDQGKIIVTSPGAVDVQESNNAQALAAELGVTLQGTGAATLPFGKTFRQKWLDHLSGVAGERHTTDQVDASAAAKAGVTGGGTAVNADDLFIQLQANLSAAGSFGLATLQQYFKELRSPGVLGTAAVLTSAAANQVTWPALTAYVAGKRFAVAGANHATVNSTTAVFWVDNTGTVQTAPTYPGAGSFAALGTAVTDGAGVVTLTDDHRALVQLDQKVLDVERALAIHVASTTAHPAANVTVSNATLLDAFGAAMLNPDTTAIANVQQALNALTARLNAARDHVKLIVLTNSGNPASGVEGDLATAVADVAVAATAKYLRFALPGGLKYLPASNTMEVVIDGDDQNLLDTSVPGNPTGVFLEEDTTHVRVYYDGSQDPLQVGMSVKLRWPNL